jgi:single-stranded-DNA-specific exonuclease
VVAVSDELTRHPVEWPADARAIDAARAFLHRTRDKLTVIACDADVDGLTAAVIVERAVNALGGFSHVLPARRGEHVHHPVMKRRVSALDPERLVVLDMGSRPQAILPDLPTLVIDHHHAAAGLPSGAVVVNGFDREPVATASVLAFVVGRSIPAVESSAWLAALGAVGDLGTAAPFRSVLGLSGSTGKWTRAVALLNAARRAPAPDPIVALDALRHAASVDDIGSARFPETAALRRYQLEVRAELERCSRVPPTIVGNVALLRFSSAAQVHPVVATRWVRRLAPRIVIAANDGYLPGRTNFAVRCESAIDLVAWLRSLPFTPAADAEYAHGHARATGGSLSASDFAAFISSLGFSRPDPIGCHVANSPL